MPQQEAPELKTQAPTNKDAQAQDSDLSDDPADMYHDIPQVSVGREEIKQTNSESNPAPQKQ